MELKEQYKFPFGQVLAKQVSGIDDHRSLFVIGAYPSALHIRWIPPAPYKQVQSLAVDNEPAVFWDGENQKKLIDTWKEQVSWKNEWGVAIEAGQFNGSSGVWVNNCVITPLGAKRSDVWFSDCLDTYHLSVRQGKRIEDTYNPFADEVGIERSLLPEHPNEDLIVHTASAHHLDRLESQLLVAKPSIIITLGNAALRVIKCIIYSDSEIPDKLSTDRKKYGNPVKVLTPGNNQSTLLPLAHPGAPERYQRSHGTWVKNIAPML